MADGLNMDSVELRRESSLQLVHHLVTMNAKLSSAFLKTNDRPWNTYFRRPFQFIVGDPKNSGIPGFEIYRVPQGRYLLLEKVVLGPIAHLLTTASGLQINRVDSYNAMDCISNVMPQLIFGTTEVFAKDTFVNEGESIVYLTGAGTNPDIISGCLYGRLLIKDIREGLDITLPDTEPDQQNAIEHRIFT